MLIVFGEIRVREHHEILVTINEVAIYYPVHLSSMRCLLYMDL